ncbi:hypothetical protein [Yersinia enterocolitica]|uniref:Restriction endonuclease type IV Mrr domain-containing protein n=1 Tax=Yersinia enterocolitica TaxID=630 RepID=A0ABM9RYR4_YEREN|nr:hypothetical protein [Yersinia enterocolitica]CND65979.1 Uncharacterised protein [Yersinia enterocolitica]CNF27557.1 Uncharacterised protein [Yersinia enterocolitica]CQD65584.1 Uncharacterised protein [Yersinia enterocolitica]CRX81027.1 Uncharacterised protein [Yersinia enterocolitica]
MRFSEFFKLNRSQAYLDFVDIPLDTDVAVFLDPGAIKQLNSAWGHELSSHLQTFFETVLRLIKEGNDDKAKKLLGSLNERNEYHLGYSSGESQGRGFGRSAASSVWEALTKSKAVKTGLLKDLEDTALLIPGIGTDMISDAVSNILRRPLIKYTQDVCKYYGVPLTPNIDSGPMWNPQTEIWENQLLSLPMTNKGKVILVPKLIVRHRITFQSDEYYRHYLLPEMQDEHLKSNSSLVELLKSGERRVTKKKLMETYGSSKQAVVDQTILRPYILDEYRESKRKTTPNPLTHDDFIEIEKSDEKLKLDKLIDELEKIKTGKDDAGLYEDIIERIFSVIFYPSLCNPKKQHEIHDGRKRIDITYSNEANSGFFNWISKHYASALIFIECKNYGKDVTNPEIDQLSSRFSPNRGKVGILVCREIKNKDLLYKRCEDTAKDGRGYILPLDDEDIKNMIKDYGESKDQEFPHLRRLWGRLIG